jgi:hypothetical protein
MWRKIGQVITSSLETYRYLFHEKCLRQWFLKKVECPLCRSREILKTHIPQFLEEEQLLEGNKIFGMAAFSNKNADIFNIRVEEMASK